MSMNQKQVIENLLSFPDKGFTMPALFVGHGSPMNAIEENEFSLYWKKLGRQLPKPEAILVISAHWLTQGTYVTSNTNLETIHDFRGFPQELFNVEYNVEGSPALVKDIVTSSADIHENLDWGLDHGAWSILVHLFPEANIPVIQLSIDYYKKANYHFEIGKQLERLRKKGVLIIGSGNIVHNLSAIDWHKMHEDNYGFDWAIESNELIKETVYSRDFTNLIRYDKLGLAVQSAIPTPDHYFPLLYVLGLVTKKDEVTTFNDKYVGGSLSMTSFIFNS